MSYADLDGVPSQTAGTSSLLASDWNTYVRDNFDSIKFGHVVVADNTAKSAISAVEGIMVYQSDVDTLFLYNGSAWVEAVGTVSLVDLAVTTAKIAASAVTSAKIADDTIVNADVNSAAAIAYSKLALGTSIVNADISTSAAIAYSKLNLASSVTSADIVNSTIVLGDLAAALQAFLTPTGTVSAFAGSSAPTGYLLCDGSAVSQTTYAALFAVVGANAFGTDGGGNFSLPNLKGRTVIGVGVGTEITGVRGTLQGAATLPAHTHPVSAWATTDSAGNHRHGLRVSQVTTGSVYDGTDPIVRTTGTLQDSSYDHPVGYAGSHNHTIPATTTDSTGTGSHGVVQPSMPLNYIIKV